MPAKLVCDSSQCCGRDREGLAEAPPESGGVRECFGEGVFSRGDRGEKVHWRGVERRLFKKTAYQILEFSTGDPSGAGQGPPNLRRSSASAACRCSGSSRS
jgi:hypothetical protein